MAKIRCCMCLLQLRERQSEAEKDRLATFVGKLSPLEVSFTTSLCNIGASTFMYHMYLRVIPVTCEYMHVESVSCNLEQRNYHTSCSALQTRRNFRLLPRHSLCRPMKSTLHFIRLGPSDLFPQPNIIPKNYESRRCDQDHPLIILYMSSFSFYGNPQIIALPSRRVFPQLV